MTVDRVMDRLAELAEERIRDKYRLHGAMEPFFGVGLPHLLKLKRDIKTNHALALMLYDTGNSDAMYLAGLLADEKIITKETLESWVEKAYWEMLSEGCIAPLAAKTPFAFELASEWIQSETCEIKCAGYALYGRLFRSLPDEFIDMDLVESLLMGIANSIRGEKIRVQNAMHHCVILAGIHLIPLHTVALKVADRIGRIEPAFGKKKNMITAAEYLSNYEKKGTIGIKIKN